MPGPEQAPNPDPCNKGSGRSPFDGPRRKQSMAPALLSHHAGRRPGEESARLEPCPTSAGGLPGRTGQKARCGQTEPHPEAPRRRGALPRQLIFHHNLRHSSAHRRELWSRVPPDVPRRGDEPRRGRGRARPHPTLRSLPGPDDVAQVAAELLCQWHTEAALAPIAAPAPNQARVSFCRERFRYPADLVARGSAAMNSTSPRSRNGQAHFEGEHHAGDIDSARMSDGR